MLTRCDLEMLVKCYKHQIALHYMNYSLSVNPPTVLY